MYNMMKMLCACSCVALQQLTAVLQVPVWQTDCHGPRLLVGVMNTHTWMATHQVEYLRGMASHSEGLAD